VRFVGKGYYYKGISHAEPRNGDVRIKFTTTAQAPFTISVISEQAKRRGGSKNLPNKVMDDALLQRL
tara:strand:+ start:1044 stop:1244 length:201 start_codon:yes stop_codon:yes gene_type:complete